jgi:sugar lactone lactonase YvrE
MRKLRPSLILEQLEPRLTPSTLIPVVNRRDVVFDAARDLLYITTGSGQVQRYDVANRALLTPWNVGTSLNGADITPDGNTLLVTENQISGSQGTLHEVDLNTGQVTNLTYPLGFLEGGSWEVAVADNGKAFFSSTFQGSGPVALRELNLATGTITNRQTINQNTNIRRGADGSLLFLTQSNSSAGPILTYDPASDSFPHSAQTAAYYDNQSSAVNRDGSLIATQLGYGPNCYYGVSVMDRNFNSVRTFAPSYNGGLAFDPSRDLFYLIDASADQVVAFDTHTWAEKFRLNIGEAVPRFATFGSGEMTVSSDDPALFLSTASGVRVLALPANPGVISRFAVSGFPIFTGAGTAGSFTVTAVDGWGDPVPGYTGTIHFTSTGGSPNLPDDYTFSPDNQGTQTFTATFNTPGTYTLRVQQADDASVAGTEAGIVIHNSNPVTLLPLANRRATVYDPTRGLLYITTSDGLVERYDPASQTLYAPWQVGASLYGADITPDGAYLYTTEAVRGATQSMLHQVNLNDGTVTNLTYNLGFYEGGTWDIAIADNGKALFDSRFEGSGGVQLHELDLATGVITNRQSINQDTHIRRGADGSLLFLTQSNSSAGPILTYDPASDSFPHSAQTAAFYDNRSSAVNRDGSLFATQLGYGPAFNYGVSVMGPDFTSVRTFAPNFNGGLAFDPTRDLFYLVDATADQVVAFDTHTWAEKFRLNVGEALPSFATFGSGEMTVSSDDSELFLSTPSGVRVLALPANPGVVSRFVVSGFPIFTGAGTPNTFTVTAVDGWGDPVPGYTGTIHFTSTGGAPTLPDDYTFSPDNQGTQTFTAAFNTPGTYTLRVQQVDDPSLSGSQTGIVIHDGNPVSLLPLQNLRDLVYDPTRGLLYITTSDGLVERYDPLSQTLYAPWQVGASLYGADITPDGSYLYTTEAVRGATQGMLHQVNLNDGTVTNFTYNLAGGEGGTWAVSIANNGKALFTSRYEGSGFLPIRELDLATGIITSHQGGTQDVHIRRGEDRSLLFLMQSNISSGPILTYDPATDSFPHGVDTGLFLDHALASVSRDGSLIAMLLQSSIRIYDPSLHVVAGEGGSGGLVFDPTRDVLYAATSTQIFAYDTNTWAELYHFDIGQAVPTATPFGSGEMTVSDDGAWLFFVTPTGVRVYPLGTPRPSGGSGGRGTGGLSARDAAFSSGGELDVVPALLATFASGTRLPTNRPANDGLGNRVEWQAPGLTGLSAALPATVASPAAASDDEGNFGLVAAARTTADPWVAVLGQLGEPQIEALFV